MSDACKTNYPIVMVHGIGFRDNKYLNYWGRIPSALETHGATIFYGNQDSWGSVHDNAFVLKQTIEKILLETGADKVNIIGHSKGGIDARYMISSLGMGEKVASLTTIASPHHGSKALDVLNKFPKFLIRISGFFVNTWFRILGDKHPDFLSTVTLLNTANMEVFNVDNPDKEDTYYQSFGFMMKRSCSDMLMFLMHFIIKIIDGDNDGIVSVNSSMWTNYHGTLSGQNMRGVSHLDEVDFRRMNFRKKGLKPGITDIRELYIEIVKDLKIMKF